jgi:hypothetical protein
MGMVNSACQGKHAPVVCIPMIIPRERARCVPDGESKRYSTATHGQLKMAADLPCAGH